MTCCSHWIHALSRRLDQLDKEIAAVTIRAENAQLAYQDAFSVVRRATLKKIWLQCLKDRDVLVRTLHARSETVEAQLIVAGVHTPLLVVEAQY